MVCRMTKKESDLQRCAFMILRNQCPPDNKHYLCMMEEDDTALDCVQCWGNYLWGVAAGSIELPKAEGEAAV